VAPDVRVTRIDSAVLSDGGLRNIDVVKEEIQSCWSGIDRFLANGFGFLVQTEEEMACFCTAEYASPGKCGTGIATMRGFERKGLATMAAAAFVEHARARGITVYWDSWNDNLASMRVAEKTGFTLQHVYEVFLAEGKH
jgi:GNAT superfamily N-acetyltransferase